MVGAPAATFLRRAAFGVISVSGLVYGTVAHAADWIIRPSLSVSEAFTDNSGLNSDNEERNSDFTTQVSPGLTINGTSGRSSLNLAYAFNRTFYHRDTQGDENNNSLAAVGQIELWKRIFFVDGQASISQVIEDGTEASSDSPSGRNVNRTEARSFNVSPFLRFHIGQWIETEPRVTLNKTTTESDQIEDTTTRTGAITINSGRRFAIFPWSITAFDRKTQNDGAQPSENERRVDGSFSYVLDRKLTLTGTVGWEEIEDQGLDNQPEGITWSGGFTARPSSRSTLQFSYGDRYDDRNISANASYRISSRTTVDASFTESIQTSQGLIAQQLLNLTNNAGGGGSPVFADPSGQGFTLTPNNNRILINGQPAFLETLDRFGLSENTFRQKNFRLNFSGSRRRNSFNGGGFWEERNIEATGIKEESYGGNIAVSRQLSSRLNGSVGLAIVATDFGTADQREEINYSGSTSLSYQVRNDIHATLSYNLTLTKVNNAPDDLLENSVLLGLTKSF
jgi:uncharacterized protein (PEP-CTERM system associated)